MRTLPRIMLLLVTGAGLLQAQLSDIRGTVTDSLTGERLPFANVVIVETSRGAAANTIGFYLIPSIPPGEYEVSASAVGYKKIVKHILVRGDGQPVEVNFRLPETIIETEEVVISGQAKQELLEVYTSIHVLDAKEMKLTPVPVQEDALQSLKMLPGIVSTSDASSKFYVRGGAGDQNLIVLDGMKIYNPFHALGIFSVLDPDIIRTTEVYTGAFPAGYGGRLSSVINITSRDGPLNRLTGKANMNFLSSKVRIEGPVLSGLTFAVNARKSVFSQTYNKLVRQNAPVEFYDVFAKATSLDTSGSKLEISFLTTKDDLRFSERTQPDYFWQNHSIGVVSSGLTGNRLFVIVSGSWSTFSARLDPKESPSATPTSTGVRELSVRASATYYSDAQDFYNFGFDLAFPKLEYHLVNSLGTVRRISELTPEAASWVNFQTSFGRFQLSTGIHLELGSLFYRSFSFDYLQPRLSASYLLGDDWRAKVSFGVITQNVLSVTNEDDVISIFDPWIIVPKYLPSQQSTHWVAGVEGSVQKNFWTSVQAYFKDNGSLIAFNKDKIDDSDPDYVGAHGVSYGLELVLRSSISIVDLYATYALSTTKITNDGLTYYPRYDRRHHINLLGTVHPFQNFDITLRWEFGSGFPYTQSLGYFDRLTLTGALPGPFEVETGDPYILLGPKNTSRLPSYHRLDLGASYGITLGFMKGSVGITIMNLYDNRNVFYFDRKSGKRVDMIPFFPSASLTLEF